MHQVDVQVVGLQVCKRLKDLLSHSFSSLVDFVGPHLGGQEKLTTSKARVLIPLKGECQSRPGKYAWKFGELFEKHRQVLRTIP